MPSQVLRMVDYGDAPVIPSDPGAFLRGHRARGRRGRRRGRNPDRPGRRPLDRRARHPCLLRAARPVGLVHFDTHTDTGREVYGVEISHGTPMFRLVEAGASIRSATSRSVCADTGRASPSSAGRRSAGSRASSCTRCASSASRRSSAGRSRWWRTGPSLVLRRRRRARSGLRARDGHARARRDEKRRLCGRAGTIAAGVLARRCRVVEVCPFNVGSAGITALVAERAVREIMTGIALRRSSS